MGSFFGLFGNGNDRDARDEREETVDDETLRLRKEELDINKRRVHSGDVELSKEIVEEVKNVDVPVTHEEVVIERRDFDNERSDSPITDEDTIRIPVSHDEVDVDKHTVVTGEVTAHKREIDETRNVQETLKKEEAHVHTFGDPDVITDEEIDHD